MIPQLIFDIIHLTYLISGLLGGLYFAFQIVKSKKEFNSDLLAIDVSEIISKYFEETNTKIDALRADLNKYQTIHFNKRLIS